MRSLGVGPNPVWLVTQRDGATWPQHYILEGAAASQGSPRIEGPTKCKKEARKDSTQSLRKSMAWPTPWLQASGLQDCKKINLSFQATQEVALCYGRPKDQIRPVSSSRNIQRNAFTSVYLLASRFKFTSQPKDKLSKSRSLHNTPHLSKEKLWPDVGLTSERPKMFKNDPTALWLHGSQRFK